MPVIHHRNNLIRTEVSNVPSRSEGDPTAWFFTRMVPVFLIVPAFFKSPTPAWTELTVVISIRNSRRCTFHGDLALIPRANHLRHLLLVRQPSLHPLISRCRVAARPHNPNNRSEPAGGAEILQRLRETCNRSSVDSLIFPL